MKLSISLSESEVALIDAYARAMGVPSRSAVLQHALRLLATDHLEDDYAEAWDEWEASGDAAVWESTAADGLRAAR